MRILTYLNKISFFLKTEQWIKLTEVLHSLILIKKTPSFRPGTKLPSFEKLAEDMQHSTW